jgi:phage terminase large subunit GpA-like protein
VKLDPRIASILADALRPDPVLLVSEWADRYRILPSDTSAEPGLWRTERTPYLREIMDCLSGHIEVMEVALMAASQVGKSECVNNFIGYCIDNCPSPVMVVQPTIETAEAYGRLRIQPMIDACPRLTRLVSETKSRSGANTLQTKQFPGGLLRLVGANAPSGLASLPIRFLLLDEVDRYPRESGTEGDPIALARQRTATFARRKIFMCSSPGNRGESKIEKRYLQGDQRRYHVPCPDCDAVQVLRWGDGDGHGGVVWPAGQPHLAAYQCEACGVLLDETAKVQMLERGEWRPTATPQEDGLRSYHLSALYSPWTTWAQMAVEFTSAKGDPLKLKVFTNTKLAETWDADYGEQLDSDALFSRREVYRADVPAGVSVLTGSVDVQLDRLEVGVWGWGAGEEGWAIQTAVIDGDPANPLVWSEVDAMLDRTYRREDGTDLRVMATAVDSGYLPQVVYDYCRQRQGAKRWAIKGMAGMGDLWPAKPQPVKRGLGKLYLVRHDAAKQALYQRLKRPPGGAGTLHLPVAPWCTRDWCQQMTTERRVEYTNKKTGAKTIGWIKTEGLRNESWDLLVYAYAALHGLLRSGYRLKLSDVAPRAPAVHTAPVEPALQSPPLLAPAPKPVAPAKRKFRSELWGR